MKHFLPTILFLLTFAIGVSAQTIVPQETSKTFLVTMDGGDYTSSIYYDNNSSSDITVEWAVVASDLPSGWLQFVCIDGGQCYPPNITESPADENWVIPAGESRWIKLQLRADAESGAMPGTAEVTLRLNELGNSANGGDVTFFGQGITTSIKGVEDVSVNIFPNPASDFIKLTNVSGIANVEIYNLIGRKVLVENGISEGETLNISNLSKGMYLVRMLDDNNNVLTTRRISKR